MVIAPACIRFSRPTSAGVAASSAVTPKEAKKPSHSPRAYMAISDGSGSMAFRHSPIKPTPQVPRASRISFLRS